MPIGSVNAQPGRIATGFVQLAEFADGPISTPVMVAQGTNPGPRLYVQCLIHGPEIAGSISAARFLRALDLSQLSGTITALLSANPFGARARNRLTPEDGANLNRVFPGSPHGSVSEQLAHRLLELADQNGDVLLDLHSGGDLTITAFYAIHDKGTAPANRESARLVAASGSRYQWASDEPWMAGSAITNFTRRYNKPALIIESGGGARVTDTDLANFQRALTGIARAMGMLPGPIEQTDDILRGGNAMHIKCTRGGYWHPVVAPGDDLTAGQVMGTMVNAFGETVEEVCCSIDKAWVGSIRRPFMPLHNGDQVVEVVESLPL